jgi:Ca2+-binding RTX toxin-like protein
VGDTSTLSGEVFITGSGFPLEGVEVTITLVGGPTTYTDTVTTDATGSYTFMDLVAGTYKVTETHPAIFLDGPEFVGSGGGTVANDEFQNVMIGPGVDLTGYDFTELGLKPEFLNSYLGRRILQHADLPTSPGVDGLIMAAMDLGLDSFFLAFNAGIDGPLEFTALYNGSLGGVTLTLVDQNFNVVKTIAGSGNQAKMTVNGTPGVPLFLDITGTNPDVDLFAKDTTPPPVNHAPEFDPLDPLFVTEGETLQVVIPATDSDGDGLFYSLGSDAPEGAEIDSATGLLTWTPADSSPTPFEFTVIVADYGDPQQAAMRTVSVMVENADPTASVAGPTVAVPYQPRTFALIANDVSPDDQASDFTFHIDWDGDGVTDQTVAGPSGMEVQHEFTTIGSFEVRVQAVDQDGGASLLATHSIDISQTMLQADETDPSLTNLVFGGSAGTDFIVVMSNGDSISLLTVVLNGLVTLTTNSFSGVTGHVVGYAGAGTDSLLGYLAFGTWVEFYGGDGLDLLIGSSGDDLLDGGNDGDILSGLSGNDQLIGGSGRDLIIGGQGADALFGDMGEDLLLGDSTRMYDGNMTALLAIHKEWNSSRTMEERIANINGTGAGPRLNGDYFLNNATLRNDNAVDNLLGGSESDWILYRMFQDLLDDLGEDDEDTPLGQ